MRAGRRGAQLHRTLYLIRALDVQWWRLDQLAVAYGVTTRTIRRDVEFLKAHGFVIEERAPDVSDSAVIEWKLLDWPATYDLTDVVARRDVHAIRRTGSTA